MEFSEQTLLDRKIQNNLVKPDSDQADVCDTDIYDSEVCASDVCDPYFCDPDVCDPYICDPDIFDLDVCDQAAMLIQFYGFSYMVERWQNHAISFCDTNAGTGLI